MNAKGLPARLLTNRHLALAFRLYLGAIFIYASSYKINFAGEFAETIAGYQLIPWFAVNIAAVVMPWIELVCGVLLLAGVRVKSVSTVLITLLSFFTLAISWALIQDLPIGCGCFHTIEDPIDTLTLLREMAWLGMAVHVYFFDSTFQLERKFFINIGDET
ncbi:MAG: DoxX family membrane protein [Desulfovibrionaceae bacterium]|nr:DoxX family membrane protein [Desulfovibrionaceae bacterium]MDD4952054.1 DoxX family membrane protein [Desulfovibrionaceae bacterium]